MDNNSSLKNVTTLLVIFTAAVLGYYLFVQKDQSELSLEGGGVVEGLFADVQKYTERRQQLDRIRLDTSLFTDERFRSLVGYSTEVPEQPIGRENPFDEASAN
jgi:hypothetical protein